MKLIDLEGIICDITKLSPAPNNQICYEGTLYELNDEREQFKIITKNEGELRRILKEYLKVVYTIK